MSTTLVAHQTRLKGMTAKQSEWFHRMEDALDTAHEGWYMSKGYDITEEARKIDEACRRLKLQIPEAWDMDGWDGERCTNIETYRWRLGAIRMKLAGEKIPDYMFMTGNQYCLAQTNKWENKQLIF